MPSNTLIIAEPPNATTKINPVDDANETNKQSNVMKTNAKVTLKYSFFITLPPRSVGDHILSKCKSFLHRLNRIRLQRPQGHHSA